MSIQDAIKEILVRRGMADKLAEEVLLFMKADPANLPMRDRWQDDVKDYSAELLSILVTCPQGKFGSINEDSAKILFRPLFASDETQAGS
jgi:hypothetical protein